MKNNLLPPPAKFGGLLLILFAIMLSHRSYTQTPNTIPDTGSVGIGTLTPDAKLQVSGCTKIDSTLTVGKSASIKGNTHIEKNLTIDGNVTLTNGDLKISSAIDSTLHGYGVLMLDTLGNVVNKGNIQSLIYHPFPKPGINCPQDINGGFLISPPIWQHEGHGMFLIKEQCYYSPRLGVGVKPTAKLQIKVHDSEITLFLVETVAGGSTKKLLQLDNSGLLHAREIKVDEDNWPDFVFQENYNLLPLGKVQQYIAKNGHLPNVPSASTIKKEGLNLGNAAKTSMQKIEELTLYLIQLNEKMEKQGKTLQTQEDLIEAQEKTIALQQKLIRQLKEEKSKN